MALEVERAKVLAVTDQPEGGKVVPSNPSERVGKEEVGAMPITAAWLLVKFSPPGFRAVRA